MSFDIATTAGSSWRHNVRTEHASTDAYLFSCDDARLFAVSVDRSGANLPCGMNTGPWRIVFDLAVVDPAPDANSPELILQGIHEYGYFIWREGILNEKSQ